MTIHTTPHLNFRGDAREALELYQFAFGGEILINTYADLGMPVDIPGAEKVVFGSVAADNGFLMMAYDVPGENVGSIAGGGSTHRENNTTITDQAMFVSIQASSLDDLVGPWDTLATGGLVVEPLVASSWSAGFGMLTDRFGVTWSFSVTP